jgi:hypothetical protein
MITSGPESHKPDKPTTAISRQLWELRSLIIRHWQNQNERGNWGLTEPQAPLTFIRT